MPMRRLISKEKLQTPFIPGESSFLFAWTMQFRYATFFLYLGGVRWLDSVNPPAAQNLEALTACIKGMLVGVGAPCGDLPLQGAIRKTVNLPESSQDHRIKT